MATVLTRIAPSDGAMSRDRESREILCISIKMSSVLRKEYD